MRVLIVFIPFIAAGPALAHVSHIDPVAVHDHGLGAVAALAVIAAISVCLTIRSKTTADKDV